MYRGREGAGSRNVTPAKCEFFRVSKRASSNSGRIRSMAESETEIQYKSRFVMICVSFYSFNSVQKNPYCQESSANTTLDPNAPFQ